MSTPLSASVPDAPLVDETVEEGSGKGVVAGLEADSSTHLTLPTTPYV